MFMKKCSWKSVGCPENLVTAKALLARNDCDISLVLKFLCEQLCDDQPPNTAPTLRHYTSCSNRDSLETLLTANSLVVVGFSFG